MNANKSKTNRKMQRMKRPLCRIYECSVLFTCSLCLGTTSFNFFFLLLFSRHHQNKTKQNKSRERGEKNCRILRVPYQMKILIGFTIVKRTDSCSFSVSLSLRRRCHHHHRRVVVVSLCDTTLQIIQAGERE